MTRKAQAAGAPRTVGLIAGNGQFPVLFAREARRAGTRVVAVAHRGETDTALEGEVDALAWVHIGQLGKILGFFAGHGVREAAMVGGIGKLAAIRNARFDWKALRYVPRIRRFQDDGLLKAIASAFEAEGVRIIPSTEFLQSAIAAPGALTRRRPTREDEADIELGREVGLAIGRADVGQTVVVRRGTVVAVEAAEGTDACIRRAGELAGKGLVVVKRSKPNQDERFDLPAIGPKTIEVMAASGASVLAVEAQKTMVLDAVALAALADREGIAVFAWGPKG